MFVNIIWVGTYWRLTAKRDGSDYCDAESNRSDGKVRHG